ncbi:MAG: putative endonuclease 4 [Microgenomates group bacterium GW2011_GWC1_46_16]|uniref:Probable endonuclease 4 n=2 Tax=Candidatus Collieribacteriota TaxID=1752725 RepID=A0A1F5FXX0_9BACT|nr:MAG: putative endonuclease 4 [Microgenomates group bacterium GW2011_GWF1_46_12]KKU26276.1 MAG: putative endonuclease 4 [Microgenomates group bacterium GW2011_GWC1_46_16]KKU27643.1 MAG: putative endonuclease 4 [Microgenomates group bacterium GW2011_GWF2_46_18]KKU45364.1 MAG: putative endonuclease 4 [Microgenomates group bacterium GW2011_GWB1_46_7]KKU61053.1 MAG: putative endonuclease 4 [Microgenomates group bacterium GW2011_GWE1_47_12]KKU62483.1 MAG: putative endonuclease 4 [Microgenomates g
MITNRRLGAHVSCAGGLTKAITNTLAIGGNAMQIFAGSPRMWARTLYSSSLASSFRLSVRQHDLNPVYIHALYLTNLASDNPELVAKSKSALIMDLTNSAAIGSAGVVLHIGSHQGRGWSNVQGYVISQIKEVLGNTPSESILLLENSAGQQGKIGSLLELGEIITALPNQRLKICLDTAHAFEAGYNFTTENGLEMWIKEIETTVGLDKVELLHLNDSKTKLGSGHDMHQNIGDGYLGTQALARLINHPSLAHLPLILEVPGDGSGPDKANIDRVKQMFS